MINKKNAQRIVGIKSILAAFVFTLIFLGSGVSASAQSSNSLTSSTSPDYSILDQYEFNTEVNDAMSILNVEVEKFKTDRSPNADEVYKNIKANFVDNIQAGIRENKTSVLKNIVVDAFNKTVGYSQRFQIRADELNRAVIDVASLIN